MTTTMLLALIIAFLLVILAVIAISGVYRAVTNFNQRLAALEQSAHDLEASLDEQSKKLEAALEDQPQERWTHSQLLSIENALSTLGKFKWLALTDLEVLESGIAHLASMKQGGPNGKSKREEE